MTPQLAQKYEVNADMGEGFGRWQLAPDAELMKYIDAANIACGFHAGDPSIMLNTIRLCKKHNMEIDPADMYALILYQIGALKGLLDAEGVELSHIKPHGELFFYMQRDESIMRAVLKACACFGVPVYAARNVAQKKACEELGVPFQEEMYVDIDYDGEGRLLPVARSKVATPELCYERVIQATKEDKGRDVNGDVFGFGFEGKPFSICIHSDMASAVENAKAVRRAVDEANKRFDE